MVCNRRHIFLVFHMNIHCIQYHFLKSTLSPLYCNGSLVPRGPVSDFCSIGLFVLVPEVHLLYICPIWYTSVIYVLFFRIILGYSWPLEFFINSGISHQFPKTNLYIWFGIALNLYTSLERTEIFSVLHLPASVYDLSLHLFSSSISQQCV